MRYLPIPRGQPYNDLAMFIDTDRRRRKNASQAIRHQFDFPIPPDSDGTIGRAQIDSDNHLVPTRIYFRTLYPFRMVP